MKKTLMVLNELEASGFFVRYAIGGAVGAIFYTETFHTEDLEILISLSPEESRSLKPISKIEDELKRRGYKEEGSLVIIEGVPVNFIVYHNPLKNEAVERAIDILYDGVPTRVPTAEYLAALMIESGSSFELARFEKMREVDSLDQELLFDLASRFGLLETLMKWGKR